MTLIVIILSYLTIIFQVRVRVRSQSFFMFTHYHTRSRAVWPNSCITLNNALREHICCCYCIVWTVTLLHSCSNCPTIQRTDVWCFHSHWSSYSSIVFFVFSKEPVFPIPKVKEATFLWKDFACHASFVSHASRSQGPLNLNANCQNKLLIPSKRQQ